MENFEDNVVDFVDDHPILWVGMCSVFGLILGIGCWKIQSKILAKDVVKALAKTK
jgi:hypothetical protein